MALPLLGKTQKRQAHFAPAVLFCASLISLMALSPAAFADPVENNPLGQPLETAASDEGYGLREGSFVVAPIPFKNVLIGAGLVLGGGYLFQMDAESDTSYLGVAAMRSENGSHAVGLGGNFAFDNNQWQMGVTLADAEAKYDLYLGNLPVPVRQTGQIFDSKLFYGLTPELLIGGGLRYVTTSLGYDSAAGGPPLPEAELDLAHFSLLGKWDTRDDSFSARTGHLLEADISYGNVVSASSRDYVKASLSFTYHQPIGAQDSLALHLVGCTVSDAAPFFDKCSLGGTDNFRGYSPAEFLDNDLLSAQIEYRHQLFSRLGLVAFAGVGDTGSALSDINDDGLKYAGGLGLRVQLSKKFKAMLSVDASVNERSEDLLYVYVGQRF
ncbi:BamA/TamA family outer membrane protein [Shimia marina]|uniref:Outer membrane protein/protective antigen OMA87 n=1 Tax=Shimia marina TaxID=321267 RepID=A0A0P1ESJ3_9RHOB|nr:BamA/TamA family outer membrane protein [Shimia marina]CUH53518.1 Outer membrane protein/protective antigen OMA87 [Shimia marina]SFD75247.1 Surface antigen [Shimia marina]